MRKCREQWTLSAWLISSIPRSTPTYCLSHVTDDILRDLAEETRAATGGAAGMQISHDEGAFLTMLTRLTGAKLAVEVGTFTGYSSICIARGLSAGGRLIACDVSAREQPYVPRLPTYF